MAEILPFSASEATEPTDRPMQPVAIAMKIQKKNCSRQDLMSMKVLKENDAYHALKAVDGLLVTGPTGTNVNDVAVALLHG